MADALGDTDRVKLYRNGIPYSVSLKVIKDYINGTTYWFAINTLELPSYPMQPPLDGTELVYIGDNLPYPLSRLKAAVMGTTDNVAPLTPAIASFPAFPTISPADMLYVRQGSSRKGAVNISAFQGYVTGNTPTPTPTPTPALMISQSRFGVGAINFAVFGLASGATLTASSSSGVALTVNGNIVTGTFASASTPTITLTDTPSGGTARQTPFPVTIVAAPTYATVNGFGDSMTAGTAATTAANRFLNRFGAATGATVINSGIGSTVLQNSPDAGGSPRTDNGRDRFAAAMLGSNKTEAALLAYGWNDARYIGAPATFNSVAFANDYGEVIAGMIAGGYAREKVYINSPFQVTDNVLANAQNAGFSPQTRTEFEKFVTATRNLAIEYGLPFADVYAATSNRPELIDGDGAHPNNTGHQVYANTILGAQTLNTLATPTLATTTSPGAGSITQTFTAPASGTVTNYTVRAFSISSYTFLATQTVTSPTATFTGLTDGTYRIMARANFSDGTFSPWALAPANYALGGAGATDTFRTSNANLAVADGTALTAITPDIGTWVSTYGSQPALVQGQRIVGATNAAQAVAYLGTQTLGSGVYIEAVIDVKTNEAGKSVAIYGRGSTGTTPASAGYIAAIYNGSAIALNKVQAGAFTALVADVPMVLSIGEHTIRFEFAPSAQRVYVDGALVSSAAAVDGTDLTGLGSRIGVRLNGAITSTSGPTVKSFRAGSL